MQGSFWWKAHLKLLDYYKGMARCKIGNGSSALLWQDLWHDACLKHKFPRLYSFTNNIDITVRNAVQKELLEDLFHFPLSREAYQEFIQLEEIWEDVKQTSEPVQHDVWTYIWGNDSFSSKKAYNVLIGTQQGSPQFNWIWKISCQAKHNFFLAAASR